eukprot:IDg12885t1
MGRTSFVQPFSVRCSCFTRNAVVDVRNVCTFRARTVRRRASRLAPISAVQVNAVSGDHDGEVGENELEKSYSVGVTVVSGCDAELRRRVIENIVGSCTGKRVVVVTASGISSTLEQDGNVERALRDEKSDPESILTTENGMSEGNSPDSLSTNNLATENLQGWLSCSSYDEMAEVIAKLASSREYDYIVAEGSTSTSIGPQEIAALFQQKGGASLRVDTLVSVLDGDSVLDELHTNRSDTSKSGTANA